MGDENPIHTLEDYSKSSHEGHRNTIELPVGNNVVPLRFDTIRLVQNGCSLYELQSKDPNQHLKDFLKLVDSLDLDGETRERACLHLFQFFLYDQASNWFERLPAGSITTWEDLTTRFLAQFFPTGRLTAKIPSSWHRFHWLQIQFFYDHVSFHLKCKTNCVPGGKLCNKNTNESWEIIKNLALYDHEGWNDTKVFAKPVKAISTLHGTSKIPDRRLLELEDQINFLLKGSRLVPMPSLTHTHQAYIEAVYSNSHPQNQNKPPKVNPFSFCKRTGPNPQPQALGTTFEAQVRDYMVAHTGRMERFRNAIFKQREEINEKRNKNDIYNVATGDDSKEIDGPDMKVSIKESETKNETKNEAKNKLIKKPEKEEVVEAPSSWPIGYYLKHRINEKLIEGLVDNNRFNDSLSGARVRKKKGKTYKVIFDEKKLGSS
nr:MAK10-like protein [Tanacetum cinerariifolium]